MSSPAAAPKTTLRALPGTAPSEPSRGKLLGLSVASITAAEGDGHPVTHVCVAAPVGHDRDRTRPDTRPAGESRREGRRSAGRAPWASQSWMGSALPCRATAAADGSPPMKRSASSRMGTKPRRKPSGDRRCAAGFGAVIWEWSLPVYGRIVPDLSVRGAAA